MAPVETPRDVPKITIPKLTFKNPPPTPRNEQTLIVPTSPVTPSSEENNQVSVNREPINRELSNYIFSKEDEEQPTVPDAPPLHLNVGGYMYIPEKKMVIITPEGIRSNDSQFLSFKKITYAVEDYTTFECIKNIHKTARVWFNMHKRKIGINPYWFSKNHKKTDVIFNPLLDHLVKTKSPGIFTAAAVQQAYYSSLNYTAVEMPTQLRVNTFHLPRYWVVYIVITNRHSG